MKDRLVLLLLLFVSFYWSPCWAAEPVVISVDGGTESLRAAVFDTAGNLMGDTAAVPYRTHHPHPGWAEQSPCDWYRALGEAVRSVVSTLDTDRYSVQAICLDTTCCTVVALDRDMKPINDSCLLWMDQRSASQASSIINMAAGDKSLAVNGDGNGPVSAEWMLPKALWMSKHMDWNKIVHVCEYQDYLNYKLTGRLCASSCNAATRWHWDGEAALLEASEDNPYPGRPLSLYQTLGIPELAEKLPQACLAMGETVGIVTKEAAEHLGIPKTTRVIQGGPDAFVGMIGLGCIKPGQMCLITGSSHLHCVVADSPRTFPGIWGPYRGAPLPGLFFVEGGQSSTGSLLRWAKRNLFGDVPSYQELDAEAATLNPGADGLVALETFQGSRTPVTDPLSRGSLVGLTLSHTRAHIWRALLEAVCFGTRACMNALEAAGHGCTEIALAGGVTRSDMWLQMHADVTNRDITVCEHSENASLLGCAVLACVGAGLHDTVSDAVTAMVRPRQRIRPRPDMVDAYDRVYRAAYSKLADSVGPVVHSMHELRGGGDTPQEMSETRAIQISPSLLACDWANIQSEVQRCLNAGLCRLHVDVFDGVFLDSPHAFTFGPKMITAIAKCASNNAVRLDLHMCVERPERFVEAMASSCQHCCACCFIFQLEATSNLAEAIDLARQIKKAGMACGVSINPATMVEDLRPLLETGLVDVVDVLAVEPGFGGQPFQNIALSKVEQLQTWRSKKQNQTTTSFEILVDGGINDQTASSAIEAGADILVAGSFLFEHERGLEDGARQLLANLRKTTRFFQK